MSGESIVWRDSSSFVGTQSRVTQCPGNMGVNGYRDGSRDGLTRDNEIGGPHLPAGFCFGTIVREWAEPEGGDDAQGDGGGARRYPS